MFILIFVIYLMMIGNVVKFGIIRYWDILRFEMFDFINIVLYCIVYIYFKIKISFLIIIKNMEKIKFLEVSYIEKKCFDYKV